MAIHSCFFFVLGLPEATYLLDAIDRRQVEASGGKKISARGSKGRDGMKRRRVEAAQVDGSHVPVLYVPSPDKLLVPWLHWYLYLCESSVFSPWMPASASALRVFPSSDGWMDGSIDRIGRSSWKISEQKTSSPSSSSSSSFFNLNLNFEFPLIWQYDPPLCFLSFLKLLLE